MSRKDKALARAKRNPHDVEWSNFEATYRRYFRGPVRQKGTHAYCGCHAGRRSGFADPGRRVFDTVGVWLSLSIRLELTRW